MSRERNSGWEKKEERQQQQEAEEAVKEQQKKQQQEAMEEKEEDKLAVPGSPLDADKDRQGFSSHKLIVIFILNFIHYMPCFCFPFPFRCCVAHCSLWCCLTCWLSLSLCGFWLLCINISNGIVVSTFFWKQRKTTCVLKVLKRRREISTFPQKNISKWFCFDGQNWVFQNASL